MHVEPFYCTDNAGHKILIRSAEEEDAELLVKYLKETSYETVYLLREPEEVCFTEESERDFIGSVDKSLTDVLLVCYADGEFAGSASAASLGPFKRYSHRCSVSIALYCKFHGKGIGYALMNRMLKAVADIGYEQVELEVMKHNTAAIGLYEKCGFKITGTMPDNMKYSDGTYDDALFMVRKV